MMAVDGPAEYKKLVVKQYPARSIAETAEGRYWRRFSGPALAKQVRQTHKLPDTPPHKHTTQIGAVTCIDVCPTAPHHFAVTASMRVLLYDATGAAVRRTFTRFKDVAYSGTIRSDGKLLVAGGVEGVVQVLDASSRAVLRQLKGHKAAVRAVRFSPALTHVLSGGDDATVRFWDVTGGGQVSRLDGHEDYVRAVAACPTAHDRWLTGGYDHNAMLWDTRTGNRVASVDHGAAIEAVAWLPSGTAFVTVGGTEVRVWDLLRCGPGATPLMVMGNHQKTVSCCSVVPSAGPSGGGRLLTGALDGHVKVYELDTYKVTHVARYPAPVLSLGIAPDSSMLAVGMADGMLSVRRNVRGMMRSARDAEAVVNADVFDTVKRFPKRLTAANYRYFVRGQSSKAAAEDQRIAAQHSVRLAPYDTMLRQFRYAEALDAALLTRRAEVVASVLEELAMREGLGAALGGRDAVTLPPLVAHISRHIVDPRYAALLARVGHLLLDMYSGGVGAWEGVDAALSTLRDRLASEVAMQQRLMCLVGMLEPLLAAGAR